MRISSSVTKTKSRRDLTSGRHIGVLLGIVVVGFVVLGFFRGGVGAAASTVLYPVTAAKAWFMTSSAALPSHFRTQSALIAEIQSLKDAQQARVDEALTRARLEAENAALATQLALQQDETLTARVLMRPDQLPYDTLLIDAGARDGVTEGAIVYIGEKIAVGTVLRSYAESALVRLVSSPGVQASVFVFGPDIFTEAEGMGGGVLRITVPQGIPLSVGDIVVLPAANAGAYGEVIDVVAVESSPHQYGYVTSPATLQSVRFVEVAREVAPVVSFSEAQKIVAAASSTLFMVDVPENVLVGTTTAPATESADVVE